MESTRRRTLLALAGAFALPRALAQQGYPNRTIRVVIPYATGGGTDVIGRPLLQAMSADLGQPIIIDNKPGAGTQIGSDAVAKAPPDGYTLLLNSSAIAINAALVPKLPYDTERDLIPIARVGQGPLVFLCRPDAPWKSLAEVIAAAKAQPGKLTYASSGNGSAVHLGAEQLKLMAQVDIQHVPYRGAGPAYTDLMGGQVDLLMATAGGVHGFVKGGRMRALAVTSSTRSDAYPGVPAVAETLPGYSAQVWYALFAPAGTPPAIIATLSASLRKAAAAPAYGSTLEREGQKVVADTPAEAAAFMRAEIARWRELVARTKISID